MAPATRQVRPGDAASAALAARRATSTAAALMSFTRWASPYSSWAIEVPLKVLVSTMSEPASK